MLKSIHVLEEKLNTLMAFVHQLQQNNQQLREHVQQLNAENAALRERMGQASTHIEDVMSQLQHSQTDGVADD